MSNDGKWWDPALGAHPAFEVRRQVYGGVLGGDYVRGSFVPTLPNTALRYPTEPKGLSEIVDRAMLVVRPVRHYVRTEYVEQDGRTLKREWPVGDVEIQWGWPTGLAATWQAVALVRASFGRPSTVNDGQTVFGPVDHSVFTNSDGTDDIPPIVVDQGLPTGRMYQYALFFRVNPTEWVRGMVAGTLLPRDFGHDAVLWGGIPPYYTWTDDQINPDNGPLRQFLSIFAFELDTTREYVEQWQYLYDMDRAPIRLVRRLGDNFGLPYESGVGDIRYRSLLTNIGTLYQGKGTAKTLRAMIEDFSKYRVDITPGAGLMLQPDDSDFFTGIGNWAGIHPATPRTGLAATMLTPDKVNLQKADPLYTGPPPGFGRGVMAVYTAKANETTNMGITLGDGVDYNVPTGALPRPVLPADHGIPISFGHSYGFSCQLATTHAPITVSVGLLWFGKGGQPTDLINKALSPALGITDNYPNWHTYSIEGTVPTDAVFLVPYIEVTNRSAGTGTIFSPYLYVAGALVYQLPVDLGIVSLTPDRYLTVGDPGEVLGPAKAGFTPFVLGEPQSGSNS